jgi:hypothetical protein
VIAVEVVTTRAFNVETGLGVKDWNGEIHLDAAQRVHDVGEGIEVQLHVVVNRNREVLFDRLDELARTFVECGVNFVRADDARVGDEKVAGN